MNAGGIVSSPLGKDSRPLREVVLPDISLDLRFFRYALMSAEHGSFMRAALELGEPQSTVILPKFVPRACQPR
jgi:hypothetical protein